MNRVLKIFLDTNILIGGLKREEHTVIRKLAIDRKLQLFVSPEVRYEQEKHSLNHYYGQYREELMKSNIDSKITKIQNVIEVQDSLTYSEKQERAFWKPAPLQRIKCTFDGLIMMALFRPGQLQFADLKGEMNCYDELVSTFKIKETDGTLIMSAHSGSCDFFLTWDDEVIKKCKRVVWLRMKVMTPRDFLKEYKSRTVPS